MKIETQILFAFIRKYGIEVSPSQKDTFNNWQKKSERKEMKYIFFDSEDMWINRDPEDIVDFLWEESTFNINDEVLKHEYGLTVEELLSINIDIKSKLLSYIDFIERMELSNQILFNEVIKQKDRLF